MNNIDLKMGKNDAVLEIIRENLLDIGNGRGDLFKLKMNVKGNDVLKMLSQPKVRRFKKIYFLASFMYDDEGSHMYLATDSKFGDKMYLQGIDNNIYVNLHKSCDPMILVYLVKKLRKMVKDVVVFVGENLKIEIV
jgi:hypothetical protein